MHVDINECHNYYIDNSQLLIHACLYKIGQFGTVYKAQLQLRKSGGSVGVAVKTIKKFRSEKQNEDFLREMTVMNQMVHPNVVRLHGLVQQQGKKLLL